MAEGAKTDEWDVAFLATDPARAEEIVFTAPYLEVQTTYLVPSDSQLVDAADIDREGLRISVSNKSAYDLFLSRKLKHATLLRANTPGESVDLFFAKQLDALAGLRPFLIGVAAKHPGTRLLDGSFMTVQQAIGVSKRSATSVAKIHEFVRDIKQSGYVARTIEKNGVKGAAVAP
jgi:polar amino acid transport system substrate-binding protein